MKERTYKFSKVNSLRKRRESQFPYFLTERIRPLNLYLSSQLFQNFHFPPYLVWFWVMREERFGGWLQKSPREEAVERNQGEKQHRPSSEGGENTVLGHGSETLIVSQGWKVISVSLGSSSLWPRAYNWKENKTKLFPVILLCSRFRNHWLGGLQPEHLSFSRESALQSSH